MLDLLFGCSKEKNDLDSIVLDKQFKGCYSPERQIGRGGIGAVYLAHTSDGMDVALKFLDPKYNGSSIERVFRAEILNLRELSGFVTGKSHDNIPVFYTAGREHGLTFYAMEFVPGKNLYELVKEKGNILPSESVRIVKEVASALSYAHDMGILNGDVKPENIMVNGKSVKLIDWSHSSLVRAGAGSFVYMSPEQAQIQMDFGEKLVPITDKSDVYNLATVLYELITKRVPYPKPVGESSLSRIDKINRVSFLEPIEVNSFISHQLNNVIMKGLEFNPNDRMSAKMFYVALNNLLNHNQVVIPYQDRLKVLARKNHAK